MVNEATLVGMVSSVLSNDMYIISVKRDSGTYDHIPVRLNGTYDIGTYLGIKGFYCSHKKGNKTQLYVIADSVEVTSFYYYNDVFIEGVLVRLPTYRLTPFGREISDLLIKTGGNYIPCVCWGRLARYVRCMSAGEGVRLAGRIQSRNYTKNEQIKTAYEVSVSMIESVK